ncbi:MAG: energy-coupling factor ABC transporter substrate-binding protein [Lachnospiraceae bacterium]
MQNKSNKGLVIGLIILIVLIVFIPMFALKGASFGGSDDQGSQMVSAIIGEEHEPWFTPVLETAIDGEIPGEIESLLFCIQTGIGVAIISYGFGYFVARKKYSAEEI